MLEYLIIVLLIIFLLYTIINKISPIDTSYIPIKPPIDTSYIPIKPPIDTSYIPIKPPIEPPNYKLYGIDSSILFISENFTNWFVFGNSNNIRNIHYYNGYLYGIRNNNIVFAKPGDITLTIIPSPIINDRLISICITFDKYGVLWCIVNNLLFQEIEKKWQYITTINNIRINSFCFDNSHLYLTNERSEIFRFSSDELTFIRRSTIPFLHYDYKLNIFYGISNFVNFVSSTNLTTLNNYRLNIERLIDCVFFT
jgi:hypothetical protein